MAQDVRLGASLMGSVLCRNNVGVLKDSRGIPVRYGLANESKAQNSYLKSSDYIGWSKVTITPDMVGTTVAVFTSIETKAEQWVFGGTERELAQERWINTVKEAGGLAGFANCLADFMKIVSKTR